MKRWSKVILFGSALIPLAVMMVPPHGQSAGSAPVTVLNIPLPVQGTVGVNNLPAVQSVSGTVAVSNLPANQTVSGTVNVGNFPTTLPVSFTNASNSPLYIRDVDSAAHNRYSFHQDCTIPLTGSTNSCTVPFTVPSGFELVIEMVTVDASLDPSETGFAALSPAGGGPGADFILKNTYAPGSYGTTQPVRYYADPGATHVFQGFVNDYPTSGAARNYSFAFYGYLVACGTGSGCPLP